MAFVRPARTPRAAQWLALGGAVFVLCGIGLALGEALGRTFRSDICVGPDCANADHHDAERWIVGSDRSASLPWQLFAFEEDENGVCANVLLQFPERVASGYCWFPQPSTPIAYGIDQFVDSDVTVAYGLVPAKVETVVLAGMKGAPERVHLFRSPPQLNYEGKFFFIVLHRTVARGTLTATDQAGELIDVERFSSWQQLPTNE